MGVDSIAMIDDATLDAALDATLHPAVNRRWLHRCYDWRHLAKSQHQQQSCTQRFEHNNGMLGAFETRVNWYELKLLYGIRFQPQVKA